MTIVNRALKAVLWGAIGRWTQLILSLVTSAIMARIIGPEGYGLFAMALVVIAFGDIFVNGTLTESLVQHDAPSKGHLDAIFWAATALGLVLLGAILLTRHDLAGFFGNAELEDILPVMAGLLPVTAASSIPLAILQRDLRQGEITKIEMTAALAASVIGLVLVFAGAGVWSIVYMEWGRSLARGLGFAVCARWMPGLSGRLSHVKELTAFNAAVLGTRLLAYVDRIFPRVLVGAVLGEQALGFLALAWRLLDQLSGILIGPLNGIALAAASRARTDLGLLRKLLLGAIRLSSLLSYPAFLGLIAIAPLAIPLIFGPAWTDAVPVIQIILLTALRSAVTTFNTAVLRGVGQPHLQMIILGAGALFVALFAPLAVHHGVIAVALVMLARSLLTWPLAAFLVKRATAISIRDQMLTGGTSLTVSAIMAGAVYLLIALQRGVMSDAALLGISIPLGVVLYAALILMLETGSAAHAKAIVGALRRGDRRGALAILQGMNTPV